MDGGYVSTDTIVLSTPHAGTAAARGAPLTTVLVATGPESGIATPSGLYQVREVPGTWIAILAEHNTVPTDAVALVVGEDQNRQPFFYRSWIAIGGDGTVGSYETDIGGGKKMHWGGSITSGYASLIVTIKPKSSLGQLWSGYTVSRFSGPKSFQ